MFLATHRAIELYNWPMGDADGSRAARRTMEMRNRSVSYLYSISLRYEKAAGHIKKVLLLPTLGQKLCLVHAAFGLVYLDLIG